MSYETIQPPFTLEFTKMSKDELRQYDKWFRAQIPVRIGQLAAAVKATPGFSSWVADFTPESLIGLGEWLALEVETRPRTKAEIRELARENPFPSDIPKATLTNRSYSLAVDTGMYFGEVLLRSNPSLKWQQVLDNKRNVNYGQPVLVGRGRVPLDPVRIALTLEFGLVDHTVSAARLRELYEIWTDMLIRGKPPTSRR
jgi:hypothetical protein